MFGAFGGAIRLMARNYDDTEPRVIARYLRDTIGVLRNQMTALQSSERAARLIAGTQENRRVRATRIGRVTDARACRVASSGACPCNSMALRFAANIRL